MDWWTLDPGYLPTVLYGPCGLVDPGTRVQGRCWGAVDPGTRVVGTVHYHVSHVTQFPNKTVAGGYSSPLQESGLDWVRLTRYSPAPEVWLTESTPGPLQLTRLTTSPDTRVLGDTAGVGYPGTRVPWHPVPYPTPPPRYHGTRVPQHTGTLAPGRSQ